jgi:hypothetical protein
MREIVEEWTASFGGHITVGGHDTKQMVWMGMGIDDLGDSISFNT